MPLAASFWAIASLEPSTGKCQTQLKCRKSPAQAGVRFQAALQGRPLAGHQFAIDVPVQQKLVVVRIGHAIEGGDDESAAIGRSGNPVGAGK